MKAGDVSVVFICDNPTDANGGTYTSDIVVHAQPPPGAGRQRNIPVNPVTVEIIGVPKTINIPRSAVATLSLPIRDALKSDALKANALLDGFYARIDRDASESVATRQYMATVANAGLEIVEGAEKRNEAADVKEAVSPIIFEDLSRRYREMLTDLSARPLRGQKSEIASPHLLKVQQKRHETITVHDSPTGASIGPLAPKLASILLNHVMTFIRYEICHHNPIASVRQPRKRSTVPSILEPSKIGAIIKELEGIEPARTVFLLSALTGMRGSEILGLQWQDVDFDRAILHVRRSCVDGDIGECKKESSRKPLPLAEQAVEALSAWKKQSKYTEPGQWVFAADAMLEGSHSMPVRSG